jgi:hypothetical protein
MSDAGGASSSDSDTPRLGLSELSADTLAALQSVLSERAAASEAAAADPFRHAHAHPRAPALPRADTLTTLLPPARAAQRRELGHVAVLL